MKTRIGNVELYTGEREVRGACVFIDDKIIVYAGEMANAPEFLADETIDGRGGICMPGLANAHSHIPMTLLRGVGGDMALMDWLHKKIFPLEAKLTAADVYYATLHGIMEQLRYGVTAFMDTYYFCDVIARAAVETGVRANISRSLMGSINPEFSEKLRSNVQLFEDFHGAGDGRIRVAIGAHAEYTNTVESLKIIGETAARLKCGLHVHVSETKGEHDECIARHGVTPTRLLYDLGLFDRPTLAAHCVWATPEDIEIYAEKGVYVAHNPVSNLKLASGFSPVFDMLSQSVNVCLATDGVASNNNLNLFEEIKLASIMHKGNLLDPCAVKPVEVIKMATRTGFSAMGFDNVGLIEPGYEADLVLLDADAPNLVPLEDLPGAIAYAANGGDVLLTMVQGKILYKNGEFTTIDKSRVLSEMRARAARIKA